MAIKKVKLPNNTTVNINDSRISDSDIASWDSNVNKVFKVTATLNASTGTYTLDKTFAEITTAYNAGSYVYAVVDTSDALIILPLAVVLESKLGFMAANVSENGLLEGNILIVNDNDENTVSLTGGGIVVPVSSLPSTLDGYNDSAVLLVTEGTNKGHFYVWDDDNEEWVDITATGSGGGGDGKPVLTINLLWDDDKQGYVVDESEMTGQEMAQAILDDVYQGVVLKMDNRVYPCTGITCDSNSGRVDIDCEGCYSDPLYGVWTDSFYVYLSTVDSPEAYHEILEYKAEDPTFRFYFELEDPENPIADASYEDIVEAYISGKVVIAEFVLDGIAIVSQLAGEQGENLVFYYNIPLKGKLLSGSIGINEDDEVTFIKNEDAIVVTVPTLTGVDGSAYDSNCVFLLTSGTNVGHYYKWNSVGANWTDITATGGGGGSYANFYINITDGEEEGTYIKDKTCAEIAEAYDSGKNIIAVCGGMFVPLLHYSGNGEGIFSLLIETEASGVVYILIAGDEDGDTSVDIQEYQKVIAVNSEPSLDDPAQVAINKSNGHIYKRSGNTWIDITPTSGQYTLPPATAQTLGGVKVGSGLTVAQDGTLSTTGGSGANTLIIYASQDEDIEHWINIDKTRFPEPEADIIAKLNSGGYDAVYICLENGYHFNSHHDKVYIPCSYGEYLNTYAQIKGFYSYYVSETGTVGRAYEIVDFIFGLSGSIGNYFYGLIPELSLQAGTGIEISNGIISTKLGNGLMFDDDNNIALGPPETINISNINNILSLLNGQQSWSNIINHIITNGITNLQFYLAKISGGTYEYIKLLDISSINITLSGSTYSVSEIDSTLFDGNKYLHITVNSDPTACVIEERTLSLSS